MSSIIRKKLFSQNAGTGGGSSTPTTQIIRYNVLNYSALAALTPNTGEFAYVKEEQGTKWLPGTIGGTYYASGLYYYTGTTWINDLTSIAAQLALNDTAILALQTGKVPYTGAVSDVNLGEFGLLTGNLEFDTTPTNIPTTVGSMVWNDTDGTLDLKLKGGNVTLQIGQEQVLRVVNKTATNITLLEANYQAVRVTGAQGQRLKVDLALATNDLLSAETIGLVTETIANNQEGFITTSGLVRAINTTGSLQSETWIDGDILYLSATTAGKITNIKPIAPNHLIIIGYVVNAHITQGTIFVKVDNGYELNELHNVLINGSLANNDALIYESSTQLWKNKTIPTALGYTPTNGSTGTTNYISKFTSANTIGNSLLQDNGVGVAIGSSPGTFYKFAVLDNTKNTGIYGAADLVGVSGTANNIGVFGTADNSLAGTGIGIKGEAIYSGESTPPAVNIGGLFIAGSGTANYSLQLQDGTQAVGKYLKCITSDGKANWDYYSPFIPELKPQEVYRGIIINNNAASPILEGGASVLLTGSNAAQTVASTNFATKQIRLRYYTTSPAAGRYSGTRGNTLLWFIHGGFRFVCDFNISDITYVAGCQQFYGLAGQVVDLNYGGAGTILVNTLTNIIGVGSENGDTNLQVFHNDAAGTATKVDLGVNFPANRTVGAISTTVYSITLYNAPASTNVLYRVVNNETGAIAEGTVSTNLPATSLGLNFFASRCMAFTSTTGSGQFDLSKLGVYSLL